MSLSYISVDIKTGAILADLIDLTMQGAMPKTLMRYEAQTAKIPIDTAPANWRTATRPMSAVIICLSDDAVTPLWGGEVLTRTTDESDNVTMSLTTIEAYLDRVYVGNQTFTATDQNTIIQTLVNTYAGGVDGIPIRVQIVGAAGVVRDRAYLDTDDKTLYSVLGDLSGVIGGPEWTIGWECVNNLYTPVLYVGTRIGNAVAAGLGPNVTFNMPGPVTKARLVESYATGQGANNVMATSSGIAGARPQSPRQIYSGGYAGRPRIEYRWSPSTSISDVNTLTAHAQRAVGTMHDGSMALTATANRLDAPPLGRDWGVGDDVGFDLTTRSWPTGLQGTARVIGWQMDDNSVTPILDASFLGGLDSANVSTPTTGQ